MLLNSLFHDTHPNTTWCCFKPNAKIFVPLYIILIFPLSSLLESEVVYQAFKAEHSTAGEMAQSAEFDPQNP